MMRPLAEWILLVVSQVLLAIVLKSDWFTVLCGLSVAETRRSRPRLPEFIVKPDPADLVAVINSYTDASTSAIRTPVRSVIGNIAFAGLLQLGLTGLREFTVRIDKRLVSAYYVIAAAFIIIWLIAEITIVGVKLRASRRASALASTVNEDEH